MLKIKDNLIAGSNFLFTFAFLRHITFIFTLYIMVISFLPCSDNVQPVGNIQTTISSSHSSSESKDSCSSFCSCSCCSILSISEQVAFFKAENVQFFSKHYPSFNYLSITGMEFSVWQPPQLG